MSTDPNPKHPAQGAPSASRIKAARHLLHLQRFAESLTLGMPSSVRNSMLAGVQTALASAVCVPLFALSQ